VLQRRGSQISSVVVAPTWLRAAAFSTSILRFPAFSSKYTRMMVAALLLLRGGFWRGDVASGFS